MLIGLAGASALATKSFASTSLEREQAHTLQASLQAESAKAEGDKTHEACIALQADWDQMRQGSCTNACAHLPALHVLPNDECGKMCKVFEMLKLNEDVPTPCDVLINKKAVEQVGRGSPGNIFLPNSWGNGHIKTADLCNHIGARFFSPAEDGETCTARQRT